MGGDRQSTWEHMAPTNNKPCAQHTETSGGQPGHTSRTVTNTCRFEDLCENVFGDVFSVFYCCLPFLYPFLSRFTQEFNCILNLLHRLPILGEKLREKRLYSINPATLEYLWIIYLTAKNGSLRSNTMPLKHSSTAFWKGLSVCFKKLKSTPNAACG